MSKVSESACEIFTRATSLENKSEISRCEILALAEGCSVRELNMLIRDLNKHGQAIKRQAYDVLSIVGCLTDEVRGRAEKLEIANE